MIEKSSLRVGAACSALWATQASAATWDESVAGNLYRSAPSLLAQGLGSNVVRGGVGAPDLDYITLVVPVGYTLSAIVTGIHNNVGLSNSFLGMQQGSVMTVPPNAANATGCSGGRTSAASRAWTCCRRWPFRVSARRDSHRRCHRPATRSGSTKHRPISG